MVPLLGNIKIAQSNIIKICQFFVFAAFELEEDFNNGTIIWRHKFLYFIKLAKLFTLLQLCNDHGEYMTLQKHL